ncbi:MAG: PHP-associated domain-containing protein [Candidatus Hermodarchaeota archaeon]
MTNNQYLYDLHNHTSPYSPCSHISFHEMCKYVSGRLSGFAITDHDYIPPVNKTKRLKQHVLTKLDLILLYGVEISTQEGELLAFGIFEALPSNLPARQVIKIIHDLGGVIIAAHPWRISPLHPVGSGVGEKVYELDLDALEINGLTNKGDNELVRRAAKELNLPTIGGSDAHRITGMNRVATAVFEPLLNETDLVKAIQNKKTKGIFL